MGPFCLGFRVLGKKTGQKRELKIERKKRTRLLTRCCSKQHHHERKEERATRADPETVRGRGRREKTRAKIDFFTRSGQKRRREQGGARARLYTISHFVAETSSLLCCAKNSKIFSLSLAIFEDSCVVVVVGRTRPFSIANEARVSLSLFSSLPMEMFSLTFSRWWWW